MMNELSTTVNREHVEVIVRRLVGLNCWHVSFVEELSPAIGLSLGEKCERASPLLSSRAGSEFGRFEGEMNLFVSCPWRLRNASLILCSSVSESDQVHSTIAQLFNAHVKEVTLSNFTWDMCIVFSTGVVLESFCAGDVTVEPRMRSDLSIRYGTRRLALGPGANARDYVRQGPIIKPTEERKRH